MGKNKAIGLESSPVITEVTKEAIIKFADAVGDPNPLYRDESAAKRAGLKGIIAPPTFPITFGLGMEVMMGADTGIELNLMRILHGEQEFEYFRPIYAGEKISCTSKIVDVYEKEGKSGIMDFIVVDVAGVDEKGEKVFVSRVNIINRR